MKIRNNWFGILCPKNNDLTFTERDIHFLLIERIVPSTIALCQAVEKPLGIKAGMSVERLAEMMTGAVASTLSPLSFTI